MFEVWNFSFRTGLHMNPLLCMFLCYFSFLFSFFFPLVTEKDVKTFFTQKQMILTSERRAEHLFAGWNMQNMFYQMFPTAAPGPQIITKHFLSAPPKYQFFNLLSFKVVLYFFISLLFMWTFTSKTLAKNMLKKIKCKPSYIIRQVMKLHCS